MCMISMIGDDWRQRFPTQWPQFNPEQVTRAEFEALRKEMEELKQLLLAAKKYDEATGQPDCEVDEKVALIKAVAKAVGVDMDAVFPRG